MITAWTSTVLDAILEKMDGHVDDIRRAIDNAGGALSTPALMSVHLKKAIHQNLVLIGEARDFMFGLLQHETGSEREKLHAIFGGSCRRVARIRAVVEMIQTMLGNRHNASDPRLSQCLEACNSVEGVLLSAGLKTSLEKAQQVEKERITAHVPAQHLRGALPAPRRPTFCLEAAPGAPGGDADERPWGVFAQVLSLHEGTVSLSWLFDWGALGAAADAAPLGTPAAQAAAAATAALTATRGFEVLQRSSAGAARHCCARSPLVLKLPAGDNYVFTIQARIRDSQRADAREKPAWTSQISAEAAADLRGISIGATTSLRPGQSPAQNVSQVRPTIATGIGAYLWSNQPMAAPAPPPLQAQLQQGSPVLVARAGATAAGSAISRPAPLRVQLSVADVRRSARVFDAAPRPPSHSPVGFTSGAHQAPAVVSCLTPRVQARGGWQFDQLAPRMLLSGSLTAGQMGADGQCTPAGITSSDGFASFRPALRSQRSQALEAQTSSSKVEAQTPCSREALAPPLEAGDMSPIDLQAFAKALSFMQNHVAARDSQKAAGDGGDAALARRGAEFNAGAGRLLFSAVLAERPSSSRPFGLDALGLAAADWEH